MEVRVLQMQSLPSVDERPRGGGDQDVRDVREFKHDGPSHQIGPKPQPSTIPHMRSRFRGVALQTEDEFPGADPVK